FLSKILPKTDINNDEDEKKKNSISRSEKLYQKEKELTDFKRDLQREERETNAEIVKISTNLKDLTVEDNDLEASIKSLELANAFMANSIIITFELTRQFLIGVQNHCKDLSDLDRIKSYAEAELKNEVIEELRSSGLKSNINNLLNDLKLLCLIIPEQKGDFVY
ncbi:unnamed protein product, partial [Brachionus calyciflorus]